MKVTKDSAKRIGFSLTSLYRKCFDSSVDRVKSHFKGSKNEECVVDKLAVVSMTHSSFTCMCYAMGKQLKTLKGK